MAVTNITVSDGKYTVLLDDTDGSSEALRYGQSWPAYPDGVDNLTWCLAYELNELRVAARDLVSSIGDEDYTKDAIARIERFLR